MSATDKRLLIRSVKNNRSTPLKKITAKFNENRNRAVSKRTVQRVLFKAGYHRRVVREVIKRECNDLVCFFDILGGYDLVSRRVTAHRIADC